MKNYWGKNCKCLITSLILVSYFNFHPSDFTFQISDALAAEKGETPGIAFTSVRHAYYRNEQATLTAVITNNSASAGDINASFEIAPLKPVKKNLRLAAGKNTSLSFPLDCALLKPGDYQLEVTAQAGGETARSTFNVFISQQPNPQRMPVVYWGSSADLMDWGIAHGFNTFAVGSVRAGLSEDSVTGKHYRALFEKAIEKRVNLGMYIYTVNSDWYKEHPEAFGIPIKGSKGGQIIDNQRVNTICLREPYVIDFSEKITRNYMQFLGMYPSFTQTLINSEFRGDPCYSDNCRKIMKQETGLDLYDYPNLNPLRPPKTEALGREAGLPDRLAKAVPVNGVIEDDNPYYKYYMWWWKRGMGDTLLNERIARIVKEYNKNAMTWHDPFRLSPTYGSHQGLDCIGQWTYTHPDPKYTAYVETMIAGAKPAKQKVMPDVTTWEYQNWLAPTDSGVVFIPKDILRENCWIALSRRPDSICHYISSSSSPSRTIDSWRRDPQSFDMMTWMGDNVYKPYGAAILQMERTPRKAAILCSASSVLFPEINRGGWVNGAIYPFYSLLMMAQIPTDVIFDETIMNYGFDGYDILILHQCETLTRSVYNKILDFKKRGGTVIGDQFLRADIPLDYRCNFDLSHRSRQLADIMLKGKGVTADEDRKIMNGYAAELRRVLDGKLKRYVDSPSTEVVLNVLKSGPVNYIVMVNDRRTYGERFGQWKTFHEKGVEQEVTASIAFNSGNPVLYDLREHARIPAERMGSSLRFTRKLGPCDGDIVAVYPNALEKIAIESPAVLKRGAANSIIISVLDSQGKGCGTQPLLVKLTDPSGAESLYSDYYATKDGTLKLSIALAINEPSGKWTLQVKDLTAGLEAARTFEVK